MGSFDMTLKPASPPKSWAKGLSGMTPEAFEQRVSACYSMPHLYAAVRYEAEHKGRHDRIATLNKRLAEVRR